MYEVLIYDERDRESKHPESTLGEFESLSIAIDFLKTYCLQQQHLEIYKVEIIKQ